MIEITENIALEEKEIIFRFIRSSGPGGQKVNKVETAVQLRFDVKHSPSLPENVKEKIFTQQKKRISARGILVIEAKRFRFRERNKADAVERLVKIILKAAVKKAKRISTKPSPAAKEARLKAKQKQSEKKKFRSSKSFDEL